MVGLFRPKCAGPRRESKTPIRCESPHQPLRTARLRAAGHGQTRLRSGFGCKCGPGPAFLNSAFDAQRRPQHVRPVKPTILLAFLVSATLQAESVTLIPSADTAMLSLNPDNNYGRLTTLPVGPINKPSHFARALLKFDVASALPAGAVVTSVRLKLQMTKEAIGGSGDTVGLHRMLVDWGEGAKSAGNHGAAATAGEANWNARKLGSANWGTPGGLAGADFVTAPSGTLEWNEPASYTFASTPGLVADVQAWRDNPTANEGWLLRSTDESPAGAAKRIVSREGTSVGQRPQLTVEFSVPPAFEPRLPVPTLAGGSLSLRYQLAAGHLYELRAFDRPGATTFSVLTNHAVKLVGFEAEFTEPVTPPQRFYQLVITGDID